MKTYLTVKICDFIYVAGNVVVTKILVQYLVSALGGHQVVAN